MKTENETIKNMEDVPERYYEASMKWNFHAGPSRVIKKKKSIDPTLRPVPSSPIDDGRKKMKQIKERTRFDGSDSLLHPIENAMLAVRSSLVYRRDNGERGKPNSGCKTSEK